MPAGTTVTFRSASTYRTPEMRICALKVIGPPHVGTLGITKWPEASVKALKPKELIETSAPTAGVPFVFKMTPVSVVGSGQILTSRRLELNELPEPILARADS